MHYEQNLLARVERDKATLEKRQADREAAGKYFAEHRMIAKLLRPISGPLVTEYSAASPSNVGHNTPVEIPAEPMVAHLEVTKQPQPVETLAPVIELPVTHAPAEEPPEKKIA